MITTDIINVDLAKPGAMHVVNAVQNDKYSRNVVANLYLNGSKFLIPDGATVVASYNKPDGTGGIYDSMPDGSIAWNIDGNSVTVALAPQVLTASGMVNFSITLIQGKFEISVFSISIHVHPLPSFTAQSEDYVNMRDWLSAELNKAIEEAKESGEFKGDPFVYEDFTEEQLAALQGEPGITPQITLTNGKELDGRGNVTIEVSYTSNDGIISKQSATVSDGKDGQNGQDGYTPVKGKDYFDGEDGQPGKDGEPGKDGADGKTPVRGVDYYTEADKDELVQMVLTELGGNPVYGYVDADNNVVVRGSLADGTYTVKYEMEDGSTVDIGNLVLGEEIHYSVTKNLTNCTISNSATQVSPGGGYSATITANSGYNLSSVKVTMGGTDITSSAYSNGVITIGSVTGNVVITASAVKEAAKTYTITNNLTNCANSNSVTVVEEGSAYNANITANDGYELDSVSATMGGSAVTVTNGVINIASVTGNIVITAVAQLKNLAEPNTKNTSDWSIWCNDARSGSDGTYRQKAGTSTTNYIPFANGSTVFVKGFNIDMSSTSMETNGLVFYKADKATTVKSWGFGNYKTNNWITAISGNATDGFTFTVSNNGLAEAEYFRISAVPTGSVMDVVINVS